MAADGKQRPSKSGMQTCRGLPTNLTRDRDATPIVQGSLARSLSFAYVQRFLIVHSPWTCAIDTFSTIETGNFSEFGESLQPSLRSSKINVHSILPHDAPF